MRKLAILIMACGLLPIDAAASEAEPLPVGTIARYRDQTGAIREIRVVGQDDEGPTLSLPDNVFVRGRHDPTLPARLVFQTRPGQESVALSGYRIVDSLGELLPLGEGRNRWVSILPTITSPADVAALGGSIEPFGRVCWVDARRFVTFMRERREVFHVTCKEPYATYGFLIDPALPLPLETSERQNWDERPTVTHTLVELIRPQATPRP